MRVWRKKVGKVGERVGGRESVKWWRETGIEMETRWER